MKNYFLYVLTFFLLSCETKEETPVPTVESVIQVELKEIQVTSGKHVILAAQTEKTFTCSNYTIQTTRVDKDKSFVVHFTGTSLGAICLTGIGPAKTQLDLGVLTNGDYELQLNNQGVVNKGTLRVSNTQITLNFPQLNGIQILTPVYNR